MGGTAADPGSLFPPVLGHYSGYVECLSNLFCVAMNPHSHLGMRRIQPQRILKLGIIRDLIGLVPDANVKHPNNYFSKQA